MALRSQTEVRDRLRPYVEHVMAALLDPGELEGWRFVWVPDGDGRHLAVEVRAGGDFHFGFVWQEAPDEDPVDGMDTFVNGFEDFISESTFAWGEQRLLRDRPWAT